MLSMNAFSMGLLFSFMYDKYHCFSHLSFLTCLQILGASIHYPIFTFILIDCGTFNSIMIYGTSNFKFASSLSYTIFICFIEVPFTFQTSIFYKVSTMGIVFNKY